MSPSGSRYMYANDVMAVITVRPRPQPHPLIHASAKKVLIVVEMARRQAFRGNPELQQFVLPEARPTGRQLGVGSYGSVEELQVKGLVCAGKRMHEALLQRDNQGVINIERKYLEECQVSVSPRSKRVPLPCRLSTAEILVLLGPSMAL